MYVHVANLGQMSLKVPIMPISLLNVLTMGSVIEIVAHVVVSVDLPGIHAKDVSNGLEHQQGLSVYLMVSISIYRAMSK